MSDADETETLAKVDALIVALPRADEPYWAAVDVVAAVSDALVTSTRASDLYLLWAGLTDWYELKPDDRAAAVGAMRRAATEWLAVKDEPAARDDYFKNWSEVLSRLELEEAGRSSYRAELRRQESNGEQ